MHSYKGLDDLFDLREKVRKGEHVTVEEYGRVVKSLREGREEASKGGTKAKAAAKPSTIPDNLNDLFATPVKE